MSFSFNFASDEIEEGEDGGLATETNANFGKLPRGTAKRHSLEEMIATLPSKISYSRVDVTNRASNTPTALYRRDLFDARFQMIHEDDDGDDDVRWKDVMAGSATDLVPGVYEGGLKTWECSLDLASVLSDRLAEKPDLLRGNKTVLELGCGTAVPSLFLFTKALQGGKDDSLTLQLCDFNEQVLRLVTVPNLILTWYFHSRGGALSAEKQKEDGDDDDDDDEEEKNVLELNEDVLEAFQSTLREHGITLELFSGHWNGLQAANAFSAERRPDIVLTSETIYSMDTMPSLVDTLDEAMNGTLEDAVQRQVVLESEDGQRSHTKDHDVLCYVAAKILYFGVGGGVYAFEEELRRRRAYAETVWKSERGVARAVLQIRWR